MFTRAQFDLGCTVEVSHRFESLHAHVHFDREIDVRPGDRVLVHGAPIHAAYGQVVVEQRTATVTRAYWVERVWTRLVGNLDCAELLDVSFSDRRRL
ncbi:MAG: hypothetical protein ACFB9M_01050 [Myxococcota bacterium]